MMSGSIVFKKMSSRDIQPNPVCFRLVSTRSDSCLFPKLFYIFSLVRILHGGAGFI